MRRYARRRFDRLQRGTALVYDTDASGDSLSLAPSSEVICLW